MQINMKDDVFKELFSSISMDEWKSLKDCIQGEVPEDILIHIIMGMPSIGLSFGLNKIIRDEDVDQFKEVKEKIEHLFAPITEKVRCELVRNDIYLALVLGDPFFMTEGNSRNIHEMIMANIDHVQNVDDINDNNDDNIINDYDDTSEYPSPILTYAFAQDVPPQPTLVTSTENKPGFFRNPPGTISSTRALIKETSTEMQDKKCGPLTIISIEGDGLILYSLYDVFAEPINKTMYKLVERITVPTRAADEVFYRAYHYNTENTVDIYTDDGILLKQFKYDPEILPTGVIGNCYLSINSNGAYKIFEIYEFPNTLVGHFDYISHDSDIGIFPIFNTIYNGKRSVYTLNHAGHLMEINRAIDEVFIINESIIVTKKEDQYWMTTLSNSKKSSTIIHHYNHIGYPEPIQEKYFIVNSGKYHGIIDITGKIMLKCKYDSIKFKSDNTVVVIKEGKFVCKNIIDDLLSETINIIDNTKKKKRDSKKITDQPIKKERKSSKKKEK